MLMMLGWLWAVGTRWAADTQHARLLGGWWKPAGQLMLMMLGWLELGVGKPVEQLIFMKVGWSGSVGNPLGS